MQGCLSVAPCVSCDFCSSPVAAAEQAAGGEKSLLYLSSCSLPLPLISLSPLLFLSSPRAVSYCTPLSIWSSVAVALPLQVCACMCRSQVAAHFWSRATFLVVINYITPFRMNAGNAILPFDGANRICVMRVWIECVCVLQLHM